MLQSESTFALPYITADLPGIGGRLRSVPEHFEVEELPLYEPQGEGQHLYVKVTKVGLATKEVQHQLAKLFEIKSGDIGFAGMKDKHARTTQTFSLSLGHLSEEGVADAVERIRDNVPVTVQQARLHKNKLKLGHLLGNRFRVTIDDLGDDILSIVDQAEKIVHSLRQTGLPNFFGPQRFGHQGKNVQRGLDILTRKQYVKDRWLRRFLISSYQSYLCNQYLAERVEMGAFDRILLGDIAKKHDTGGLFDVEEVEKEQERYIRQEISFTAPLYGPKMRAAQQEAGRLEAQIFESSGITMEQLRKARVEGTRRLGRLLVPDIAVRPAEERKDALVVEFSLTKGAFATTVLREIMKNDAEESSAESENNS